jgi:4-amino-4-deoxy-L-arabinose transferase-like glycosyltransferase/DNA-binding beta-propeller fold protein YncE
VLAIGFRLYDLGSLPEGVWFDEADHGTMARRILQDGSYRPLWIDEIYRAPAHHAYLIAGAMKVGFGAVTSIRVVSVLFGLAAVAGAYLVGRELWGRIGAVAAVSLVGLERWPVTVSRIGMFNIATPATLLLGTGLVLVGLRRDRATPKLIGGAVLGFGLAFHASMLLALVGAALVLATATGSVRAAARGLWLAALGVVVVAAPIFAFAVRDTDTFRERQEEVSLFSQDTDDKVGAARDNARKVLEAFHVEGDQNGRHNIPGEPLLDPVAGGLTVVGLALLVRERRRPLAGAVAVWGLVALVPGVITLPSEAPNALRIIGTLPALFLVATAGVVAAARALPPRVRPALLALVLVATAAWTVKDYFGDFRNDPRVWAAHSIGETIAARASAANTADAEVVSVARFTYSGVMGLLGPGTVDHTVFDDEVYPLRISGDEDALIIADRESGGLVAEHRLIYGDETVTEYRKGSELAATLIEVPAAAIRARQGLLATYAGATTSPLVRPEHQPGGDPATLGVQLPTVAEWDGLLLVERTGIHGFRMDGIANLEISIDGEPVAPDETLLHVGPHHIEITGTVTGEGPVSLQWRPPAAEFFTVPPGNLWVHDGEPRGLFGTAWEGRGGDGALSRSRLDASLHFLVGQADAPRPRLLRWEGYLTAPTDGLYRLGVESNRVRSLRIDGRPVVIEGGPDVVEEFLVGGIHAVELEVVDEWPDTSVRLVWALPGEELATVPSTFLVPPWVPSPAAVADAGARARAAELRTVETEPVIEGPPEALAAAAGGDKVAAGSADGTVTITVNDQTRSVATEGAIADLAVAPDGSVLVLDPEGRILVIDDGSPRVLVEDTLLGRARGITVADDGTIVVALTANEATAVVSADGTLQVSPISTEPPGQPIDVVMLGDGSILMTDAEGPVTRRIDRTSTVWETPNPFAASNAGPHLAVLDDLVFRTDPQNHQVVALDIDDGRVVAAYELRLRGEPVRPVGIATTPDGQILVADVASGNIVSFTP